MGGVADAVADGECAGDGDEAGRRVEKSSVWRGKAKIPNQSCGVCCYYAA